MTDSASFPDLNSLHRAGAEGGRSTEPAAGIEVAVAARQRKLHTLVQDAPACLANLAGPDHLVTVTNKLFRQMFGDCTLAGLPLRVALPELESQPFFALLDEVYHTGTTCYGHEEVTYHNPTLPNQQAPIYFTFVAQATREPSGLITGLLLFTYNVSAHVVARQQAAAQEPPPPVTARQLAVANQQLALANEELATTNEELSVSNEELDATNDQLSAANEELKAANEQLRSQNLTMGTQAHKLYQAQKTLRKLNLALDGRITERTKQLQAALRSTEQHRATMAAVFHQTPAAVCLLRGPGHRFEYVNPSYQELYPGRPLQGRLLAEALPEAHSLKVLLDEVFTTGKPYHGQEVPWEEIGPHGPRIRFFDFTYQAFHEQDQVAGVAVFAFDVTEQVRVREQVAVVVFRGPRYVIELANPAVCEIWGRTAAQVIGRPLFEALPEASGQGFEELLDGVLATGVPYVAHEMPSTLDRAGQRDTVYWNFICQPLPDVDGKISGVTIIATDVTEQVQARQQFEKLSRELSVAYVALQTAHVDTELTNAALSQSNDRLTRTNADLDSFVYAASHDLKLPVLNLAGLFEELRRGVTFTDPAEEQVLVPLIEDSLRQLSTTLDDLSALGQVQQGAAGQAETVVLEELVHDVLQVLEPQLRAAQARVTTDFSVRATLVYPRVSLRTVLLNLLSNAFKYADPARPARVHVSLWVEADQPVLWVEDNGLGFDATGNSAVLFQLFRRFHDHTEGTGVGLYLVNRLVQANGGHIEVDSQVGEGTTFRVYLGKA